MAIDKKRTPPSPAVLPRKHPEQGRHMTSERIDADLAAFHAAGGHIEVLGTTYVDFGKKKPAKPDSDPTV